MNITRVSAINFYGVGKTIAEKAGKTAKSTVAVDFNKFAYSVPECVVPQLPATRHPYDKNMQVSFADIKIKKAPIQNNQPVDFYAETAIIEMPKNK